MRGHRGWPLTHVCSLITTLHDGPVNAGDQPRAQDAADEQPGEAGAQAQQHVVEEQKVVEVVEHFPANGSRQRGGTHSVCEGGRAGRRQGPQTYGPNLHLPAPGRGSHAVSGSWLSLPHSTGISTGSDGLQRALSTAQGKC